MIGRVWLRCRLTRRYARAVSPASLKTCRTVSATGAHVIDVLCPNLKR